MLREKKAGMVHFTKVLPVFHAAINFLSHVSLAS